MVDLEIHKINLSPFDSHLCRIPIFDQQIELQPRSRINGAPSINNIFAVFGVKPKGDLTRGCFFPTIVRKGNSLALLRVCPAEPFVCTQAWKLVTWVKCKR